MLERITRPLDMGERDRLLALDNISVKTPSTEDLAVLTPNFMHEHDLRGSCWLFYERKQRDGRRRCVGITLLRLRNGETYLIG